MPCIFLFAQSTCNSPCHDKNAKFLTKTMDTKQYIYPPYDQPRDMDHSNCNPTIKNCCFNNLSQDGMENQFFVHKVQFNVMQNYNKK